VVSVMISVSKKVVKDKVYFLENKRTVWKSRIPIRHVFLRRLTKISIFAGYLKNHEL